MSVNIRSSSNSGLSAQDVAEFSRRRQAINNEYKQLSDTLNFDRQQFAINQPLRQREFTQGWQQAAARVPSGFGRAGMLNSGVYQRALQSFARQKSDALLGFQQESAGTLAGFDLRGQNYLTERQTALLQLEAERAARQAAIAASLRNMRR